MKTSQLRSFVEEFLAFQGAKVQSRGERLLAVKSPKRMAQALGSKEILLAFDPQGLQDDPRSELGTVGNPVFDRILELARDAGRVGERFATATARRGKLPDPTDMLRFAAKVRVADPTPVYAPVYFVVFRIEYSLEEAADELEIVPVDGLTLQTLAQTPELGDYWQGLSETPPEARALHPAFPVSRATLTSAVRLLERRLRRRLGRLGREAAAHLERETRSIESYYQQLIEETRNAGRRWVMTPEGREEKIRLLQLDWKRRIEEAQQAWMPAVEARLSAVAAVQRPRLEFLVEADGKRNSRRAGKGGAGGARVWWDETDQGFLVPPCRGCGTVAPAELMPVEDGFLCPGCVSAGRQAPTGRTREASKDDVTRS